MLIQCLYKTYRKHIQSIFVYHISRFFYSLGRPLSAVHPTPILQIYPIAPITLGGRYRPSTPSPSHPFIPLNPSTHPARLCLGTLPSIYNIFSHARNIILPYRKLFVFLHSILIENRVYKTIF